MANETRQEEGMEDPQLTVKPGSGVANVVVATDDTSHLSDRRYARQSTDPSLRNER